MGRETIFIVDDHPLVIDAIGQAIATEGDFNIISASSAAEMRRLLDSDAGTIRLIFLDMKLPDANGIDLIPLLISRYGIPIIAISGGNDEEFASSACLKKGAAGFIQKSSNLTTFSSALRIVLEGGLYFPAGHLNGNKIAPLGNIITNLNDRQRQVLDLILKGKSNKQIGDEIYLAEGSVKNKVSELLSIFDVKSRSQMIAKINQLGYIPNGTQERNF